MGRIYFSLSELCIEDGDIPLEIADKLIKHHIQPMNIVRKKLGAAIWASQDSGYRSKRYELSKKRTGKSQHTFKGKGAVDWTAIDLDSLLKLIIEHTDYTRICFYPHKKFIHCDYKSVDGRFYYEDYGEGWEFIKKL